MPTREQWAERFAQQIRQQRIQSGRTVAETAERWGVDERTYRKYERGQAAPNLLDFCCIMDASDGPILKPLLNFLHPDRFTSGDGDIAQIREDLAFWAENIAADRVLRQVYYNLVGQAADNVAPQLEMISALQHMPLFYRVMVVKYVLSLWELAEDRGELLRMEHVPPDIPALRQAAQAAEEACRRMKQEYSTIIERE